jgi:tetratricopeptide (TPR) repeat protein
MKNPDDGRMTLLRFWETDEGMNRYIQTETRVKEGLPLAERLLAMPAYAKEANLLKAGILRRAGRYEEAIAAYQASDDPPRHLLGIADCYLALKQTDKAVEQWREVARKFEARAPEMAFKIAQAYRDAGQTDQYETELREIVRTYLKHPDLVERARAELEALKKPK